MGRVSPEGEARPMDPIYTYQTDEGPIEVIESIAGLTLRSPSTGESLQLITKAQDLIDCGLDPAPVVSIVGQLGIERRMRQRQAAVHAREELANALIGRLGDYALGIDGVSVTLTLTIDSAIRLADLVRGVE